jgi:hypothetical protein
MRHLLLGAFAAGLLCQLTVTPSAEAGEIRPLQHRGNVLLHNGMARSTTFRHLVAEIQDSDVVVYVDLDPFDRRPFEGVLEFVGSAPGTRFVRVWLRPTRNDTDLIVMFGHELQHAIEVARAADVVSRGSLTTLYRSIGRSDNPNQFETEAALETSRRVRTELNGRIE